METNNPFACTGQPLIPKTSGLKQLPQSVEQVYTNSARVGFPQPAKGLNGEMPVNGLISPSVPSNVHGTFASDTSLHHHPTSNNYDYLWNYPKPPMHRDIHGLVQYQINGSTTPVTNGPLCKVGSQELWGNGSASHTASHSFSNQDLCNFSNVKLAAAANGLHHGLYQAAQPGPLLGSSIETFSPSKPSKGKQKVTDESDAAERPKDNLGLVQRLEPSDEQADDRVHEYNGTNLTTTHFNQSISSPLPPPDVSNLDDPSQLPSQFEDSHLLNSDSLDPFGTDLSQEPRSNTLYNIAEQQTGVQEDRASLLQVSALDCPSYTNSASFPLIAESGRSNSPLYNKTFASPVLGKSVMQDSASEMDEDSQGRMSEEPNSALDSVSEMDEEECKADETNTANHSVSEIDEDICEIKGREPDSESDDALEIDEGIDKIKVESAILATLSDAEEDPSEEPEELKAAPEVDENTEEPNIALGCVSPVDDGEKTNAVLEKNMKDDSHDEVIAENTESSVVHEPEEEELEAVEVKGSIRKRRVAKPDEVRHPLLHGWKREVRIRKGSHRWQGETWYYAPCGKRMKQFPEVIKYLSKSTDTVVRREHFSFSPRIPIGDFYEEQDAPDGKQWVLLNSEEIPSRIVAITGKRGRPRNPDKEKVKVETKGKRGRGRPPKAKMINLLSKPDAKLMKKLESQELLNDEEKLQLRKLKKKMRRKARNLEAKQEAAKKAKEKKGKEEKQKANGTAQDSVKEKLKRKPKEKVNPPAPKPDRKQLAEQRRLEERQHQQFMLEELKKPTEDMCLPDHQPLPEFPHVPGVILPSCAFSDCLNTVEFLHTYGKVLGLDVTKEVPSLCTLQEGLLNFGDSLGEVQDLLVKLLRAAMFDPGLPPYCQYMKILGEKVSEISLNRDNVSEVLRLFMEAYGGDIELCESLRSHPFQAHTPQTKAAVLSFLVNELNASNLIINEIDKTLENMSNYRKNKWIIEGKIRRLKFSLRKRTCRSEPQITTVGDSTRRRSAHITEENEVPEGDESLLQKSELVEEEDVSSGLSIGELEIEIERLTKRQIFFRKKLISSAQRLRCVCLGQDRYRRFYWMVPHLGGIFVEGAPSSTEQISELSQAESAQILSVKTDEPEISDDNAIITPIRSRGRPRKPKPELEHTCKLHQCSEAGDRPVNVVLDLKSPIVPAVEPDQDLKPSEILSWLTQNQNSLMNSTVLTPESSPPHMESTNLPLGPHDGNRDAHEKPGHWFHLLPRTPCSDPSKEPTTQQSNLLKAQSPSETPTAQAGELTEGHQSLSTPLPAASTPCAACTCSRRNSIITRENALNSNLVNGSTQERRRGRPPSQLFRQIEQKYHNQLIHRPVPADMRGTWWWIKDPVILESLFKALHPRGIREKSLKKHLSKHLEHLKEMCARPANDPLFQFVQTEGHTVSCETLEKWSIVDWTFQVDMSILQWIEDLENRVFVADLQQKGWTPPSLDSTRSDLKYFEHQLDASDDILAKVKKEDTQSHREKTNPLDLAVLRLLDLEINVERRYLKEPLWLLSDVQHEKIVYTDADDPQATTEIEYDITPRVRLWRLTVERCRSAAQLSLCLQQFEKSIAWERSVNKVTCLVCRKGDNDEYLLLCDSCDRGCHTYCHRPQMKEIPEGDWFCPNCVAQQGESEFLRPSGSSRRLKKRRLELQENNSPSKSSRRREQSAGTPYSSPDVSLAKRRRLGTRSQSPDLSFCEIILMEMETHDEAWPFLAPVNPRLVPGYRKIIKNPMDFSTMRHKLLDGKYSSYEEFAEDAELVFSNCQLFNEDDSEVGKAGLIMKQFYESRWEEFSQEHKRNAV
ncbi:bromodomain adjacent to zinc finger domain protein 2A [Discoglossus pictus]